VDLAAKRALHDALVARLEAQVAAARAAHGAAIEGATHAEAKPENDKDTRGLEQSYLARGHAARTAELEAALLELTRTAPRAFGADDPVAIGAVVDVVEGDARRRYLIAAHGGGEVLPDGVQVVTARSPLGQALLGKRAGDVAELGTRELEIETVG
jgi:transcription elongation GreA/GreB family factor